MTNKCFDRDKKQRRWMKVNKRNSNIADCVHIVSKPIFVLMKDARNSTSRWLLLQGKAKENIGREHKFPFWWQKCNWHSLGLILDNNAYIAKFANKFQTVGAPLVFSHKPIYSWIECHARISLRHDKY